jgi:UDP-N-acetylglucosamine 2-epimerase (non-hydrolysing)
MKETGTYKYIQTNQHPQMNRELERLLGLKGADLSLSNRTDDLRTPSEIPPWFLSCLVKLFKNRSILRGEKILVTQGDTLTTLFAALVARIFGLKLAHIEAGLRSYSMLHPFPEEIIRRLVSKSARYLFAPGSWAAGNLANERGEVIDTRQNTVYDVLGNILLAGAKEQRIVAAIHRQETIYNPARLEKAVSVVRRASEIAPVLYVLHEPSEHQLKKLGFYEGLHGDPRITLHGYFDYLEFMGIVSRSLFVISDGGGLQEETYFLNVPCLLLRNRTERTVGLGVTACLSEFKDEKIEYFLSNYEEFRRRGTFKREYPCRIIADRLESLEGIHL